MFLGLLLAMLVIFMLSSEHRLFAKHYRLTTSFENISGLSVGAKVQLAGVNVGYVDAIHFPMDAEVKRVDAMLKINTDFQTKIREDSVAIINTQGLLGDKYILISVGSASRVILKDGDRIESRSGTSVLALAEKGGEIMEDIGSAAKAIREVMESVTGGDGKSDFKALIKSARRIAEDAQKGDGLINALVYDPKGKEILNDMSDSLRALKNILGSVEEDSEQKGRIANIVENLEAASINLKLVTEKIERGEGTVGGLIQDPTIYYDLRTLFGRASRSEMLKMIVRSNLKSREKKMLKD